MNQTFDAAALKRAYHAMQPGDPRMRAIRAAITEAEQARDDTAALVFHHDLIHESVFSGDRYQALVDFPQYLALAKSTPELELATRHDRLWIFKWIVEAASEFPQIEKKQVLSWFNEFRRELIRQGYSLRPFYEKRAIFYSYCDRAKLRLDFEDFRAAPRDSMCDGKADEYNTLVRWYLHLGDRARAMDAAKVIFEQDLHSDEIPASTYGYLLADAMAQGDDAAAEEYAKKLRPLCIGQRFRLEQLGLLLSHDAKADPSRGLVLYLQHLPLREHARNPLLCFWFDRGAAALLAEARKAGLDISAAPQPEDVLAAAKENAVRFDARNGSDFFMQQLQSLL